MVNIIWLEDTLSPHSASLLKKEMRLPRLYPRPDNTDRNRSIVNTMTLFLSDMHHPFIGVLSDYGFGDSTTL